MASPLRSLNCWHTALIPTAKQRLVASYGCYTSEIMTAFFYATYCTHAAWTVHRVQRDSHCLQSLLSPILPAGACVCGGGGGGRNDDADDDNDFCVQLFFYLISPITLV